MSDSLFGVLSLVLALVVVASNVYWYRREQIIRDGLMASREWDAKTANTSDHRNTVEEMARLLNTSPDSLEEEIGQLLEKVRSLEGEVKNSRERWASMVWAALGTSSTQISGPTLILHLPDGDDADATALAKQVERDGVTVVCGMADQSFTVDVGDTSSWSAEEIATEITSGIPGGAGGFQEFAQGGSSTDEVFTRCRSVCEEVTDADPTVVVLDRGPED